MTPHMKSTVRFGHVGQRDCHGHKHGCPLFVDGNGVLWPQESVRLRTCVARSRRTNSVDDKTNQKRLRKKGKCWLNEKRKNGPKKEQSLP